MTKELMEHYSYDDAGYMPVIIREGWQVAKLNYIKDQDIEAIDKLERHKMTDEVFILLEGTAVLIAAEEPCVEGIEYKCEKMKRGMIYNIPTAVWHNIVMFPDAELIIVEKDNTHLRDVEYRMLSDLCQKELKESVQKSLNS